MRIAQIAPLFEAVPPKLYGGTERVVSALTEELVALGHDVTLFASGDSVTKATLDAIRPQALRLDPEIKDWVSCVNRQVELVRRRAHEFDVMHFHIDYFPNSVMTRQSAPFVTTIHGRLDLPEFAEIYRLFPQVPLVSISDNQRAPLPDLGWIRTVLHGMPEKTLQPVAGAEQGYLAFLGRISPEKGIESAIRIAGMVNMKLKVAAKSRPGRQEVFRGVDPAAACPCPCRVHRRDQRRSEARVPCPAPMRCCSRSTGRSRSAW